MTVEINKINNIWYKIYRPVVPSTKWVISLHGLGEVGNPDGSQIGLVDAHGYPQRAKAGFEFPFNIVAPQIPNTQYSDYWKLTSVNGTDTGWFVNWVKETLLADEIVVTGLSLGGRGTWHLLRYDIKGYIKAIAPVCGYYDSSLGSYCALRSVPGYSVHHQNDTTMIYSWDKGGIDKYNACSQNAALTQVIDGVTRPLHYLRTLTFATTNPHNAWDTAYDITAGNDSLLTWIKNIFTPVVAPVKDPIVETYLLDGVLTFKSASGVIVTK